MSQDFDEDLRSEIGGHFLQAVEGAFALPAVYDARELHTAMKVSLLETLCKIMKVSLLKIAGVFIRIS